MFKKLVIFSMCLILCGQNILFAQQHNTTPAQKTLIEVQQEALSAQKQLSPEKKRLSKVVDIGGIVAVLIATTISFTIIFRDLVYNPNDPISQKKIQKSSKDLVGNTKALQEIRQSAWYQKFMNFTASKRIDSLDPNINFILDNLKSHPQKAFERAQVMFKKKLISEREYKELVSWMDYLKGVSKPRRARISYPATKEFFGKLEASSAFLSKKSILPKRMARIFCERSGFFPALLLVIGGLALNQTAQAQDASMMQRIAANPNLFLKASPETLTKIEQDPLANQFCREFTAQLVIFSQMSSEELRELEELINTGKNREKTEKIVTRELKKSLQRSLAY